MLRSTSRWSGSGLPRGRVFFQTGSGARSSCVGVVSIFLSIPKAFRREQVPNPIDRSSESALAMKGLVQGVGR
jgi:hypothetical protein